MMAAGSLALNLAWLNLSFPASEPDQFPLLFYQRIITGLDGRQCPSYPVCSLYASQAIDKHGLLLGSWFMLDRLIHEADDLRLGSWIMIDGQKRLNDSLMRNDYWLGSIAKGEQHAR